MGIATRMYKNSTVDSNFSQLEITRNYGEYIMYEYKYSVILVGKMNDNFFPTR